jgi:hypothetical protein
LACNRYGGLFELATRGCIYNQESSEAVAGEHAYTYRVLRYTPNLVRDEWVNIGVLVYDENTGERQNCSGDCAMTWKTALPPRRNCFAGTGGTRNRPGGLAAPAGQVGRNTVQRAATGSPEGCLRQRSGRGNRTVVRRSCGPLARLEPRWRAGQPGNDSFVLRASVNPKRVRGSQRDYTSGSDQFSSVSFTLCKN